MNKETKILMYGDLDKLKSLMDSHFLDQLTLVSDYQTQEPKTIKELNEYVSAGGYTHVLVPDEHFHKLEGSLKNCIVPIIELLGDHWIPWAIKRKREYMKENGIKNAIVFSKRFQKPYKNTAGLETVLFGYKDSEFYNKNKDRDIDVLIHGSLGEDTYKWVYPVRNWLAEILPEIGVKEGINIVYWKHPGYDRIEGNQKNFLEDYSNILNKSKIAIGGSSHWRLPLKKFYEATACGAILLSDLPLEDKEFFENRILEIKPEKITKKEYAEDVRKMITETLLNYDKLKIDLNPFRAEQDRFNKSYKGRALDIRKIVSRIH